MKKPLLILTLLFTVYGLLVWGEFLPAPRGYQALAQTGTLVLESRLVPRLFDAVFAEVPVKSDLEKRFPPERHWTEFKDRQDSVGELVSQLAPQFLAGVSDQDLLLTKAEVKKIMKEKPRNKIAAIDQAAFFSEQSGFFGEEEGLNLETIIKELRGNEISLVEKIEAKLRDNEEILQKIKARLKSEDGDPKSFRKRLGNL